MDRFCKGILTVIFTELDDPCVTDNWLICWLKIM